MALEALADAAPTLKEAELRVLLELLRRQLRGAQAVKISSRELATACKISRSNVQPAIDSLTARSLITMRQGTPTAPAIYQVNVHQTAKISGPVTGPPPTERWPSSEATMDLFQGHTGPAIGPPPIQNAPLARAAAASDFDPEILTLIDQVNCAKGKNLDRETLAAFRRYMQGFLAKFGIDDRTGQPFLTSPNAPLPPSDDQVAQLIAVDGERSAWRLLENLFTEGHHQPHNYYWFVAVGLQRIHGVSIEARKKATRILVDVKRHAKQKRVDAGKQADLEFTQRNISELARIKKM